MAGEEETRNHLHLYRQTGNTSYRYIECTVGGNPSACANLTSLPLPPTTAHPISPPLRLAHDGRLSDLRSPLSAALPRNLEGSWFPCRCIIVIITCIASRAYAGCLRTLPLASCFSQTNQGACTTRVPPCPILDILDAMLERCSRNEYIVEITFALSPSLSQKLNSPLLLFPNGYTTMALRNSPTVIPMAT